MLKKLLVLVVIVGLISGIIAYFTPLGLEGTKNEIDTYILYFIEDTSSDIEILGDLTAGHKYRIEVELHEFGLGEANVSGLVTIAVAGEVVISEQMSDYTRSQDRYHPAIAHATSVYDMTVDEDCQFAVTGTFASGETWSVTVYDNVPDVLYLRLFVAEILTLIAISSIIVSAFIASWYPCVACIKHNDVEEEPDLEEDELSIDPV